MAVLETFISVGLVGLVSFAGVLTLRVAFLKRIMLLLVSFSAGALFGDAFIHLLPEAAETFGMGLAFSLSLISGIAIFFLLEKVIHWRHCHHDITEDHPHPFGMMNLIGDGMHNFLDGMVIAASYLASPTVGIATTVAVVLHEIPQEVGDFAVLIHAGYSKGRALFLNFLTAMAAFVGAGLVLLIQQDFTVWILPFTAGGFVYIAGSDLIPELKKENESLSNTFLQLAAFLLGVGVMVVMLVLE